ncbi:hypothetical protein FA95DRAFT_1558506 [Auriscalpium vulgare]|uniref:Uncharacterized protein n=1 Tax=Auriscalpium vulgare TaxID=40419 RepID=A0ACB8RVP5_9AGAM|nr:hypothetical protein FA95DRAFT_1558506 [Auriscalpium vulgare]
MTHLTTFKWFGNDVEYAGWATPWPILATSCKNLRHVEVYEGANAPIWGTELFELSNLTFFRYVTSPMEGPFIAPDMTRLGTMLTERCPHLQTLYLDFGAIHDEGCLPADIGPSVLNGRWPRLVSLTLHGTMCAPADVVTFLHEHKTLQHVDIDQTVGCKPLLPQDMDDFSEALEQGLECPSDILPNLETLACFPGQAVDILRPMFTKHRAGKIVKLFLKDEGREDDNPRSQEFRGFETTHASKLTVVRQNVWNWKW